MRQGREASAVAAGEAILGEGFTISTEQQACSSTRSDTLPSRKCFTPVMPCEPSTIRSGFISSAAWMISSAGLPLRSSVEPDQPASRRRAASCSSSCSLSSLMVCSVSCSNLSWSSSRSLGLYRVNSLSSITVKTVALLSLGKGKLISISTADLALSDPSVASSIFIVLPLDGVRRTDVQRIAQCYVSQVTT